jgi:ABC-2 type transport system permease protein
VPTQAMPVWLAAVADWNPLSATAGALRELFGNPGMAGPDAAWPVRHAVGMAVAWPILLMAIFIPLSVRQYRRLGR